MAASVALFIDPFSAHFEHDRLFDVRTNQRTSDDILAPWVHLRRRLNDLDVVVHTADMLERVAADLNIFVSLGQRVRFRRVADRPDVVLSAFFAFECPIVEPQLYADLGYASRHFRRMYSFSAYDALRPFLTGPVELRSFRLPQAFDEVDEQSWQRADREFLTIINANKLPRLSNEELYTERLRAVEYFARYGEIDLYGVGWDGPPYRMGGRTRMPAVVRRAMRRLRSRGYRRTKDPLWSSAQRVYRGAVVSKVDTLGRYTFAICFENMVLKGWITEKIFDCLRAGTVPVYLGAPDIEHSVWPECFVDMRRFSGYDELREFLHALSPAEIQAYRDAGREYFTSEQFRPFTKETFASIFEEIVRVDAGVDL
ncbi:MAG: hypothetical protein H0U82_09205 [Actinobacteria bacterium]|nr:hypothetical protein [Actinomycetota bacterium]